VKLAVEEAVVPQENVSITLVFPVSYVPGFSKICGTGCCNSTQTCCKNTCCGANQTCCSGVCYTQEKWGCCSDGKWKKGILCASGMLFFEYLIDIMGMIPFIGMVVGVILALCCCFLIACCCFLRKPRKDKSGDSWERLEELQRENQQLAQQNEQLAQQNSRLTREKETTPPVQQQHPPRNSDRDQIRTMRQQAGGENRPSVQNDHSGATDRDQIRNMRQQAGGENRPSGQRDNSDANTIREMRKANNEDD